MITMGGVEAAFRRQHRQRGMTVEEIANERRAAAMHTADEDRPAGEVEATRNLVVADWKRSEPFGFAPDSFRPFPGARQERVRRPAAELRPRQLGI